MKKTIIFMHNYSYSVWKLRNDILHNDKEKSKTAVKKICMQERIADLYSRGWANLTHYELRYFKLPLEQQQRKGIESMSLWITMVESIFRKRGRATQVKLDTWLTGTTPPINWRERKKPLRAGTNGKNQMGDRPGRGILDPR